MFWQAKNFKKSSDFMRLYFPQTFKALKNTRSEQPKFKHEQFLSDSLVYC